MNPLLETFLELVQAPFKNPELVWGIVPLYFSWLVSEVATPRATFATAIQTGFALLWSGAHWGWDQRRAVARAWESGDPTALLAVTLAVTLGVLLVGMLALWAGVRRRYPAGMKFLGHIRFSAYFMIAIFPIQSGHLPWTWERLLAVVAFALPVWVVVQLLLWPVRRR